MKQEYKVESLNTCSSEVQQQTYAPRLELEDAHHDMWREQIWLQEELVMKEKALRDNDIKRVHEMEEMKRAQQKLETESNYSGKRVNSQDLSQQAVIPSLRSMLSRDKRLPVDTWNLSESQGNIFGNPRPMFDSSQALYQLQVLQVRFQCKEWQGHLSQANWVHDHKADFCNKAVNH